MTYRPCCKLNHEGDYELVSVTKNTAEIIPLPYLLLDQPEPMRVNIDRVTDIENVLQIRKPLYK